jgi:hypothetical protein
MSRFLLRSLQLCVAIVLANPDADLRLVPVVLDEIAGEGDRWTADEKVVVDTVALVERYGVAAKQLQQVLRVVARRV